MLIGAGFFSAQAKYIKWKEVCAFAGRIFGRCENCQKDTPEYSEKRRKNMKDKIFGVLQRVGRSFMLPIAVLPVAGLLLGIGSSFTNETTIATYGLQGILGNGTVLHALLMIMSKAGNVIFDNLPIILQWVLPLAWRRRKKRLRHFRL